jgi:hypothetical protein
MVKKTIEESEDLKPEHCNYVDEGCDLSPSCLDCPFPRCVEELPLSRQKLGIEYRNREIVRLYQREKKNVRDLARQFHIHVRTIERILKDSS